MKVRGVYICGLPGSHKYRIAEYLNRWLGWRILDLQKEVESRMHRSMLEIIENNLLDEFRRQELDLVMNPEAGVILLSSDLLPSINELHIIRENGIIPVYLSSTTETLEKSIQEEPVAHPILKLKSLQDLNREVEELLPYMYNVPTEGFTDREVAIMITRILRSDYALIYSNGEKIYLGINSFKEFSDILRMEGFDDAFFITFKRLFLIHFKWALDVMGNFNMPYDVLYLPDNQSVKNLERAREIWKELIKRRISKYTPIVALGGGSSMDLTGFTASTFQGGMHLVLIPTTFTAQVEVAVGGVNMLNLNGMKNVLGTSYYPRFILMDPVFLLSLREQEFYNSLVTAIKFGLLHDGEIIDTLEKDTRNIKDMYLPSLEHLIRATALAKVAFIHRDAYGWRERRFIKFGWIVSSILQDVTGVPYSKALAIGLKIVLDMSRRKGVLKNPAILERVEALYRLYSIDATLEELPMARLREEIEYLDSFYRSSIRMVLIEDVGKPVISSVDAGELVRAFEEYVAGSL